MGAIDLLCNKCILISKGDLLSIGNSKMVINVDLKDKEKLAAKEKIVNRIDRKGQGNLRLIDVLIEDENKNRTETLISGKPVTI